MNTQYVPFMQDLEGRYRAATGLVDRSQYKIFYGPVRPAEILALGINPGGDPAEMLPDGVQHRVGPRIGAASAGYYENNESDLLDCNWPENNVLKLLIPLVGGERELIRSRVVKTNMAFRRSKKANKIDIDKAKAEAAPFLTEIIAVVQPRLILLTGVKLDEFARRYCRESVPAGEVLRDDGVKQTIFRAARVALRVNAAPALAVQVAHASQFSWTYERYQVADMVRTLLS
jgi:hypothetical protein